MAAKCNPPLEDTELAMIWQSACRFAEKVQGQEGYVAPDAMVISPSCQRMESAGCPKMNRAESSALASKNGNFCCMAFFRAAHASPSVTGSCGKYTWNLGSRGNAKNSLYPNKRVIDNEDDCLEVMAFDHVCAEFKNCRRSGDNFLSCDVDVMDCDNSHSDNPAGTVGTANAGQAGSHRSLPQTCCTSSPAACSLLYPRQRSPP